MKTAPFKIINIVVILFCLTSCEAFLRFNGNVYDSSNKPIPNAKKRPIENIGSEQDSVSIERRNELRKSGIKDDLHVGLQGKYIRYKTLYTNESGYFKSQTILIGCGFGCPKVRLVVEKDSLKKVILMDNQTSRDSLKIILQ